MPTLRNLITEIEAEMNMGEHPDNSRTHAGSSRGADVDPKEDDEAPDVQSDQPADEPRGDDEVRRELGPGDGDDPPPDDDDEPLRDS